MTLVVVTEQDIMTGIRGDAANCPVARAVSRAFGRPMCTGGTTITDGFCLSPLPPAVMDWVTAFDLGRPVPRIWFYV